MQDCLFCHYRISMPHRVSAPLCHLCASVVCLSYPSGWMGRLHIRACQISIQLDFLTVLVLFVWKSSCNSFCGWLRRQSMFTYASIMTGSLNKIKFKILKKIEFRCDISAPFKLPVWSVMWKIDLPPGKQKKEWKAEGGTFQFNIREIFLTIRIIFSVW